jgi:hypothetical protein
VKGLKDLTHEDVRMLRLGLAALFHAAHIVSGRTQAPHLRAEYAVRDADALLEEVCRDLQKSRE